MRFCLPLAAALGLSACIEHGSVGSDYLDGYGGAGSGGIGLGGSQSSFPQNLPTLSVLDSHPVLGEATAEVIVRLSHAWLDPVSVYVETIDGTATGDPTGNGDYQPVSELISFPPGMTEATISIPIHSTYGVLTLDTTADTELGVVLSQPANAKLADAEGRVTLAHAGMVVEAPDALRLVDGDVIPDFNADKRADLVLCGDTRCVVLLTPATVFEESAHVVVDGAYRDGVRAFSFVSGTAAGNELRAPFVQSDDTMPADFDHDGISDLLVVAGSQFRILYGHAPPFGELLASSPELSDGVHGTALPSFPTFQSGQALQTGDWDGDGLVDLGQARSHSSSYGGIDAFEGYYGFLSYGSTHAATPSFSFASGLPAVGQASQAVSTTPGASADLNGDGISDIVFSAVAANDNQYGGNRFYVRFGQKERFTALYAPISGTLDGKNGFQVDNPHSTDASRIALQDAGDLTGDGIDDLVLLGCRPSSQLSVIFGSSAGYSAGSYASLDELGAGATLFEQTAKSARVGDVNGDGIDDLVMLTLDETLRIIWGKVGFSAIDDDGISYPSHGELPIDVLSPFDEVIAVGDLDGDGAHDVILGKASWKGGGAALVLFGKTLTRILGGPNLDHETLE